MAAAAFTVRPRPEIFEHGVLHFSEMPGLDTMLQLVSHIWASEGGVVRLPTWLRLSVSMFGWSDQEATLFWDVLSLIYETQQGPAATGGASPGAAAPSPAASGLPLPVVAQFLFVQRAAAAIQPPKSSLASVWPKEEGGSMGSNWAAAGEVFAAAVSPPTSPARGGLGPGGITSPPSTTAANVAAHSPASPGGTLAGGACSPRSSSPLLLSPPRGSSLAAAAASAASATAATLRSLGAQAEEQRQQAVTTGAPDLLLLLGAANGVAGAVSGAGAEEEGAVRLAGAQLDALSFVLDARAAAIAVGPAAVDGGAASSGGGAGEAGGAAAAAPAAADADDDDLRISQCVPVACWGAAVVDADSTMTDADATLDDSTGHVAEGAGVQSDGATIDALAQWLRQAIESSTSAAAGAGADDLMDCDTSSPTSSSAAAATPVISSPPPLVLEGIARSTAIVTTADFAALWPARSEAETPQQLQDVRILNCQDAFVYVLAPARYAVVRGCVNCTLVLGAVAGAVTVEQCESVNVVVCCRRLRISNCLESIFHTYSVQGPLLSGYNRANHLAPFHTTYPGMLRHLQQARLLVPAAAGQWIAPGPNRWNELTMLEGGAGKHAGTSAAGGGGGGGGGGEKAHNIEAATPLAPAHFRAMVIPVTTTPEGAPPTPGGGAAADVYPFVLPAEYAAALAEKEATVSRLQAVLKSKMTEKKLDAGGRASLERAVQAHFKEWLVSSGNVRQVLDLATLQQQQETQQAAARRQTQQQPEGGQGAGARQ